MKTFTFVQIFVLILAVSSAGAVRALSGEERPERVRIGEADDAGGEAPATEEEQRARREEQRRKWREEHDKFMRMDPDRRFKMMQGIAEMGIGMMKKQLESETDPEKREQLQKQIDGAELGMQMFGDFFHAARKSQKAREPRFALRVSARDGKKIVTVTDPAKAVVYEGEYESFVLARETKVGDSDALLLSIDGKKVFELPENVAEKFSPAQYVFAADTGAGSVRLRMPRKAQPDASVQELASVVIDTGRKISQLVVIPYLSDTDALFGGVASMSGPGVRVSRETVGKALLDYAQVLSARANTATDAAEKTKLERQKGLLYEWLGMAQDRIDQIEAIGDTAELERMRQGIERTNSMLTKQQMLDAGRAYDVMLKEGADGKTWHVVNLEQRELKSGAYRSLLVTREAVVGETPQIDVIVDGREAWESDKGVARKMLPCEYGLTFTDDGFDLRIALADASPACRTRAETACLLLKNGDVFAHYVVKVTVLPKDEAPAAESSDPAIPEVPEPAAEN